MSIAEQITRLQDAKGGIKTALEAQGVTVPDNATLDAYPQLVQSIDTSEDARPADWLPLPDISNAQTETIVMLLHIPSNGVYSLGFEVEYEGDTNADVSDNSKYPVFRIDWGDGTVEETDSQHMMVNWGSMGHMYDFSSIDAPTTKSGEKQLIVQFANVGGAPFVGSFKFPSIFYEGTTQLFGRSSIVKETKVFVPENNDDFWFAMEYPLGMRSFEGHNIYGTNISNAYSLKDFRVIGSNYLSHQVSYAYQLKHFDIPDNKYTAFSVSSGGMTSIDIDASRVSIASITGLLNLNRMKLRGYRRGFTLGYSKMNREGILELFESLGTANESAVIRITNTPVYDSLTDEDKAIVRDKGWTIA